MKKKVEEAAAKENTLKAAITSIRKQLERDLALITPSEYETIIEKGIAAQGLRNQIAFLEVLSNTQNQDHTATALQIPAIDQDYIKDKLGILSEELSTKEEEIEELDKQFTETRNSIGSGKGSGELNKIWDQLEKCRTEAAALENAIKVLKDLLGQLDKSKEEEITQETLRALIEKHKESISSLESQIKATKEASTDTTSKSRAPELENQLTSLKFLEELAEKHTDLTTIEKAAQDIITSLRKPDQSTDTDIARVMSDSLKLIRQGLEKEKDKNLGSSAKIPETVKVPAVEETTPVTPKGQATPTSKEQRLQRHVQLLTQQLEKTTTDLEQVQQEKELLKAEKDSLQSKFTKDAQSFKEGTLTLSKDISTTISELSEARKRITQLSDEVSSLKKELQSEKQESLKKHEEASKYREQNDKLYEPSKKILSDNLSLRKTLQESASLVAEQQKVINEQDLFIKGLEQQIKELHQERLNLSTQRKNIQEKGTQTLDRQSSELSQELQAKDALIHDLQSQKTTTEKEKDSLQTQIASLTLEKRTLESEKNKQIATLQAELEATKRELQKQNRQTVPVSSAPDTQGIIRTISELGQKLSASNERVNQLEEQNREKDAQLKTQAEQIQTLNNQNKELRLKNSELGYDIRKLQQQKPEIALAPTKLQGGSSDIRQLTLQLDNAKQNYEKAVKEAQELEKARRAPRLTKRQKQTLANRFKQKQEYVLKLGQEIINLEKIVRTYQKKTPSADRDTAQNITQATASPLTAKVEKLAQRFNNAENSEPPSIDSTISAQGCIAVFRDITKKQQQCIAQAAQYNWTNTENFTKFAQQNHDKVLEALSNSHTLQQLKTLEEIGYRQAYSKLQEDSHNLEWITNSINVTDRTGQELCKLHQTVITPSTGAATYHAADGNELQNYRQVTIPETIQSRGNETVINLACRDSEGNNMPAQYGTVTLQYDSQGKLVGITTPEPIFFAGEDPLSPCYVNRNGINYTLPFNKEQYNNINEQISKNQGVTASLEIRDNEARQIFNSIGAETLQRTQDGNLKASLTPSPSTHFHSFPPNKPRNVRR